MHQGIKLDEQLSPRLAVCLREAGYSVSTVLEQGWGGLQDPDIWTWVCHAQLYSVTADLGFSDIRAFPPGTHPGILVLRPDHQAVSQYEMLLRSVVSKYKIQSLVGAITVATNQRVRIRRKGPPSS